MKNANVLAAENLLLREEDPMLFDPDSGRFWIEAGFDYRWYDFYHVDDEVFETHVLPVGDTGSHIASPDCKCCPQMDENGVWLHWAYDGRDDFDQGKRRPS